MRLADMLVAFKKSPMGKNSIIATPTKEKNYSTHCLF